MNCSAVVFFNCGLIHFYDKSFKVNEADFDLELVCTLTQTFRNRLSWNLQEQLQALGLRAEEILCLRVVEMSRVAKAHTVAFSLDSVASQHAQLDLCLWQIAMLLPGLHTVSSW